MRPPATVRLFIALWPSEAVRQAIVRWQSKWQWTENAGPVKADRLHLTLHFLGNVEPERIRDLEWVLGRVVAQSFTLQFGHGEMWQHGTAVLRPENSPTALRGLHGRIGLALAEIGVKPEDRAFRPHVTLARRAQGATPPADAANFEWEANGGFVLVQTLGGGRGYEVLKKFEAQRR